MTFDEAYDKILKIFPHATCNEETCGQLIIYTDCTLDDHENVVDLPEE